MRTSCTACSDHRWPGVPGGRYAEDPGHTPLGAPKNPEGPGHHATRGAENPESPGRHAASGAEILRARVARTVAVRKDHHVRVVVAGSSGLIGSALVSALRAAGDDVLRLVRRAPAAPDERGWDPPAGRIDDGTFAGVDAVVNLNGVGIGDRPWSGTRKQAIRDSRNVPTEVLAIAVAEHRVATFVSASGINYYGDTGARVVDETGRIGDGFLAEICQDWEAATAPAAAGGARVVLLRSGPVLSPAGGILGRLRPLFGLMLGGRLGSGEQYFPWISLEDEIGAIRFVLETPSISGPVNLVGPEIVTNAGFTRAVAKAVGRPAPFVVPAFALKAVLGNMAEEMLLTGPGAIPAKLEAAGYQFCHPRISDALTAAIQR